MRSSSPRKLVGFGSAIVASAMLLSTASVVTAAVPTATATSAAIPDTYSAGHAAGFRGFFQLTENTTLSKLFLRVDVDPATGSLVYWSVKRNGAAVPASNCSTLDSDVLCTFKTVRTTDKFEAVVAYTPLATTVVTSFVWSSVGVPDNGDQSHGDDWDGATLTSTLNGDSTDYAGGLSIPGDTTIANAAIRGSNIQATRIVGLPVGVAASVNDGSNAQNVSCTVDTYTDCASFIGVWSEVTVGDGQDFPLFNILISFASGTPKSFVHTYTDSNGDLQQEPVDTCAKKNPTYPCFTWSAKTNTATIFTLHNGSYRGQ
jgi:hypothetical protein